MVVLVTGSSGLVGSEAARYFDALGCPVHGVDNNMRADFFGPGGDTTPVRQRLEAECPRFTHHDLDVRDRVAMLRLFERLRIDLVVHGEVYNIGGGRANSVSILECIDTVQRCTGRAFDYEHESGHRRGDHICYISDMRKFRSHYPAWALTRDLPSIWDELLGA